MANPFRALQKALAEGTASTDFPIGTDVVFATDVEQRWRIVHYGDANLEDGTTVSGAYVMRILPSNAEEVQYRNADDVLWRDSSIRANLALLYDGYRTVKNAFLKIKVAQRYYASDTSSKYDVIYTYDQFFLPSKQNLAASQNAAVVEGYKFSYFVDTTFSGRTAMFGDVGSDSSTFWTMTQYNRTYYYRLWTVRKDTGADSFYSAAAGSHYAVVVGFIGPSTGSGGGVC